MSKPLTALIENRSEGLPGAAWWQEHAGHWLRNVIQVILVTALGLNTWSFVSVLRATPAQQDNRPSLPAPDRSALHQSWRAADWHLFGIVPAGVAPSMTVSDSRIDVDGIIYAGGDTGSLALLSFNGDAQNYRVGQALPDGETLAHIEPAAVVLSRAGELRRLELDIRYADANAKFATAGLDGREPGSWANAYTSTPTQDLLAPSVAKNSMGIAIVPSAAAADQNDAPLSLSAIRAQRSARFTGFKDAPIQHPTKPRY